MRSEMENRPIFSDRLRLNLTLKINVKGGGKRTFKVKVKAENMGPDCLAGLI